MSKETCTTRCKLPYTPSRDIQHYCPREKCCRWYHVPCMAPNKHHDDDYRLLDYSNSSVDQLLLDIVLQPESKPLNSSSLGKPKAPLFPITNPSSETDSSPEPPQPFERALSRAQQLHPQIRAIATSAITRGVRSGNGIVGNAWEVTKAQWLARQVIVEGKILTPEEERELIEAAAAMNSGAGIKLTRMAFECQGCGNPI
jgi:hypothetical protein